MLKRTIRLTLICLLLVICSNTVYATDLVVNMSESDVVTISGDYDAWAGKQVVLQILNPGKTAADIEDVTPQSFKDVFAAVEQVTASADGVFSFPAITVSGPDGYYNVRVTSGDSDLIYKPRAFSYLADSSGAFIISQLSDNTVSSAGIAAVLNDYADILEINEFCGYSAEKQNRIAELFQNNITKIDDVKGNFDIAVFVDAINTSDVQTVQELLKTNPDMVKKLCKVTSVYDDITNDEDLKILCTRLVAAAPHTSVENFIKSFSDLTVFTALNTLKSHARVETILRESENWLQADFSEYYGLESKKKVNTAVINGEYENVEDLIKTIDDVVYDIKHKKPDTSSGGGGGSVASGGMTSSVKVPTHSQDNAQDVTEEVYPFEDTAECEWAEEAIGYLYSNGIVNGTSSTVFAPMDYVTREEFVKMAVLAFGISGGKEPVSFADCQPYHWAFGYVSAAVGEGIINGQSETHFGIGEKISRQDMALILYRTLTLSGATFGATRNFSDDNDVSAYAAEAVAKMAGSGMINGMGDGSFKPHSNATRAQAAKMIYEVMTTMEVNKI